MRVFTGIRARAFIAALVTSAGLTAAASAGTVVIIEGSDTKNKLNEALHQVASLAETNYTNKGYTIKRLSNAGGVVTRAAAVEAMNMDGVNAMFFIGHGTQGTARIVLDYPSGGAAAKALTPADLAGNYNGIKHVEIQACQQKQDAWSTKFPNASLDAWTGSITVDQAKNDVKNGSAGRIPQKNPAGTSTNTSKVGMDNRILQQILTTASAQDAGAGYMFGDWTELGFQLPTQLALDFGNLSFNIQTTNGSDVLPIRGLAVSNGVVVNDVNSGFSSGASSFTLSMDWQAFDAAMQNIDLLPSLFNSGQAQILNNTTGIPDEILFNGAAGVYFGYGAIPTPGAMSVLALGGMLAARRRRR